MPAEHRQRAAAQLSGDNAVHADAAIMQSLAHPLRLRLLGLLRMYGPSTATKLATRVEESSGLTSYHLRQLASAGLVAEAEPDDLAGLQQTGGRERWWKAAHRSTLADLPAEDDEAGMAAMEDYARVALASTSTRAQAWLSASYRWSREWRNTALFSDNQLRLTTDQAMQLQADIAEVIARYPRNDPSQPLPADTAIITAQFQIYPNADQEPPTE